MRSRRWIEDALYSLEQDYHSMIQYYQTTHTETDVVTGTVTRARSTSKVKAVILPEVVLRQLYQNGTFSRANPNFQYGATSDVGILSIMVRKAALKGVVPMINDSFITAHKRYEVKKVEVVEHQLAYLIVGQHIEGLKPYEVHVLKVESRLNFIQDTGGTTE